jgi:hypothetical protein
MTGWRSSPAGVKPRYSTVTIAACHGIERGADLAGVGVAQP